MFLWHWLLNAVSWVLVQFHSLFSVVLDPDSGWSWTLAIVGLVILIRILLIPLFVKQIRAQRNMQAIQPRLKEIQVLRGASNEVPVGVFKWPQYQDLLVSFHEAEIFGVPLYGTFVRADETPNPTNTRILAVILIILMSATSFLTQRQLLLKNTAGDNPIARQMKIMMYVFPVMFAVGGMNFPIGVLIYWFTTNVWTMGQQFWVIRNNPQPGTPAADLSAAQPD